MKDIQERIEGSFRLLAFRRMRQRLFIIEIALLLAIAVVVMAVMGANFEAGYLPMDYFAFIMAIMALLLVAEYQYFRLLEIAHTKSKSGKFLMARNSIRGALVVILICILFVSFFVVPASVDMIEKGYTTVETKSVNAHSSTVYNFTTRDMLGTKNIINVNVYVNSGNVKGYILLVKDYHAGSALYEQRRKNTDFNWTINKNLTYPAGQNYKGFEEFVIYINNSGSVQAFMTITLSYRISSIFTDYMPIYGIIFIIVEGLTISYFLPIREKYSASSIFSKNYVESKDVGAEMLSERALALDKTLSDEEIEKSVEESVACAPPVEPQLKPEEKREQARKKGVLDVEPTMQKDVPCGSCGAMNSPDAGMCFSCGAVMVEVPKVKVTPDELMHMGREFLKSQRNQDAIWCFDEVLKTDHKNEQALFLKAKALAGDKRFELAIQYLNTVIQQNPSHQMAFTTRGEIFESLEMYDRAVDSYEKALALGPDEEISRKLKELKEGDKEEILNSFMMLPGIGPAKAAALYDAGFTSIEALRTAPLENIARVKGIGERQAKKMLKEMGRE